MVPGEQAVSARRAAEELRPRQLELLGEHRARPARRRSARAARGSARARPGSAGSARPGSWRREPPVADRDHRLEHRRQREPRAEQEAAAAELDEGAVERDVELDEPLRRGSLLAERLERGPDRPTSPRSAAPRRTADDSSSCRTESRSSQVVGAEANGDHAPVRARLDEPSPWSTCRALRTGPRLTESSAASCVSTSGVPSASAPSTIASRSTPRDAAGVHAPRELDRVLADGRGQRIVFENC